MGVPSSKEVMPPIIGSLVCVGKGPGFMPSPYYLIEEMSA